MKGRVKALTIEDKGMDLIITAVIPRQGAGEPPREGASLTLEIRQSKNKRSLNANAYCWKLCSEIGKVIHRSPEWVYKDAIREAGVHDFLSISMEALPIFSKRWEGRGIGWTVDVMEVVGDMCTIRINYGSSVYNSREMANLIDSLVMTAEEMGIPTEDPEKVAAMLEDIGR